MINSRLFFKLSFLILFSIPLLLTAEPTVDVGKTVFKNYCASCHAKDMKSKLTGPALGGVEERWADYPRQDLYDWIRNSQKMIQAGHPKAVELWNEWKPTVMTAWPNLTDEEIESVMLYIDAQANKVPETLSVASGGGDVDSTENGFGNWIYWVLLGILGFLALILTRIVGNLNHIATVKEGGFAERKTLVETLTSKSVVSFLIFAAVILGGYLTVTKAVNLGRQQAYAPEQPIKFSHETHAGLHKIDCQYCHDGARRSKHAVIPATNTCMNCHKAIKVGSEYGTAELTKIYASIGYDPSTDKYIEDYESLSQDEVESIYTKWIGDNIKAEKGIDSLDQTGLEMVQEQWTDLVSSLTNEQKKKVQGPIEWERIHNLPDHVYFNHSQHVTVGKVECEACHGKVEEMAVVEQHAPLSMGWCINCHRQTEVQFEGNEYYDSYENYHEQLANGDRDKVTVEDIGGLECQKCHY